MTCHNCQSHMQALRKAQKRPTALPLQSMPQDLHRRSPAPARRNAAVLGPRRERAAIALGRHERSQCGARDQRSPRYDPAAACLAGERCQRLMEEKIKGLDVRDVEVDEIWGFVGKKEAHRWEHEKDVRRIGDAYCFVAMEHTFEAGARVPPWQAHSGLLTSSYEAERCRVRQPVPADERRIQDPTFALCRCTSRPRSLRATYQGLRCHPAKASNGTALRKLWMRSQSRFMGNPDSDRICTSACRTPESSDPYGNAAHDTANKCVFRRNGRTWNRPMPSGLRSTTFAVFTPRCASLLRWKRGLLLTLGRWRNE